MDAYDIRTEIYKRRNTIRMIDIARNLGVSPAMISLVIERKSKSARVAKAIADAIELPVEDVFPEMFECHERRSSACN